MEEKEDLDVANMTMTMTQDEFENALKESVADQCILDLTDHIVHVANTIKLGRGECLAIKNGTLIGECHSIFSMGTKRGYDNGPPALTLEGTTM
jgi:hypothetical protein